MRILILILENASNLKAENLKSKTASDNFGNLKFKINENSEIIDQGPEKGTRFFVSQIYLFINHCFFSKDMKRRLKHFKIL